MKQSKLDEAREPLKGFRHMMLSFRWLFCRRFAAFNRRRFLRFREVFMKKMRRAAIQCLCMILVCACLPLSGFCAWAEDAALISTNTVESFGDLSSTPPPRKL